MDRRNRVMETQQKVAFDWSAAQVVYVTKILVEIPLVQIDGRLARRWFVGSAQIDAVGGQFGNPDRMGGKARVGRRAAAHADPLAGVNRHGGHVLTAMLAPHRTEHPAKVE